MPTKPLESLLYREFQKAAVKEIINVASPVLKELVNHATNAFMRCQDSPSGRDVDLPVLICYLHVIEMTDGLEELISQSCAVPAIPLLRSSFEALLAIRYILMADYQRRSFAWLVTNIHDQIIRYEMLDPNHARGKEFQAALAKDEYVSHIKLPMTIDDDLVKKINRLESVLTKSSYVEAEYEYQILRQKISGRPNWYSFWRGPTSLEQLSNEVGMAGFYQFLYRHWSRIAHAFDYSRFIKRGTQGQHFFQPLRDPNLVKEVSSFGSSFLLDATKKVIDKFRPGEKTSIAKWYEREIRNNYFKLTSRG